jgi:3-hydroxyacyl-CoA dehydrogenase/enoyl-CoA hydratase/3-hydroxybutyryl-CoA epimerase
METINVQEKSATNMDMKKSITLKVEDSIGWLELDLEGEKVNKFSTPVMYRIKEVLEEIRNNQEIKVLVVVSKKEKIYIAGADINEIRDIREEDDFLKAVSAGQGIMNEFEDLKIPVIAAINGACVGGGCEFALACDYRLASDDKSTKIGLPEVQLGIIPGFGGCVRLPRVVGLQESLGIILAGKSVPAKKALKIGLVDAMIPAAIFDREVKKYAQKVLKEGAKKRKKTFKPSNMAQKITESFVMRGYVFKKAKEGVMKQSKGHYPAPLEALKVVKDTYKSSNREKALKREAEGFIKVAPGDVSKNLIGLYFMMEDVKKATGVPGKDIKPKATKHVSVLGAGTMGGGIAQLAADKGIFVRMKDISVEAIAVGLKAAHQIWDKKVKRRHMTSYEYTQKMDRLSGGTDYSGFKNTDVVIEAIVEDMNIKKKVIAETASHLKEDAIIATNTSSLSVTEMAEAHPNPKQFVGMHFFNPVHRMPLVEVIRGRETSDEVVAQIFKLSKDMGKTPVVVKDGPGFLVNRLLLPWLAEALFILEDGMDVVKVDRMYTHTFGMPMGPYRLMDEVGLDVCVKVLKIFKEAFTDRIETSDLVTKLAGTDRLGKKNGKGFYKYDSKGKELGFDEGIYKDLGLNSIKNDLSEEECIQRGIYTMINEASRALLEDKIVETPEEVDLAMIMGTGFPPFRGGLLKYADSKGIKEIVSQLDVYESKYGKRFKPSEALIQMVQEGKNFY